MAAAETETEGAPAALDGAGTHTLVLGHTQPALYVSDATFPYQPSSEDGDGSDLCIRSGDVIEVLSDSVDELGPGWSLGRL